MTPALHLTDDARLERCPTRPHRGRLWVVVMALAVLVLQAFIATPVAWAAEGSLESARELRQQATSAVEQAQQAFTAAQRQHALALARVEVLRGQTGILQIGALRQALRTADEAAEVVAARDRDLRNAQGRLQTAEAALVQALRGQIRGLGRADVDERRALERELQALETPAQAPPSVSLPEILQGAADDRLRARAALAELADAEARLQRELDATRATRQDAEARARIDRADRRFSREESLWDDEGGVRVGSRRGGSRGTAQENVAGSESGRGPSSGADSDSVAGVGHEDSTGALEPPSGAGGWGSSDAAPESGAAPGADMMDDGVGGMPEAPPPDYRVPGAIVPPSPPVAPSRVNLSGRADPTVGETRAESGRSRRGGLRELRDREAALEAELENLRRERTAIERTLSE